VKAKKDAADNRQCTPECDRMLHRIHNLSSTVHVYFRSYQICTTLFTIKRQPSAIKPRTNTDVYGSTSYCTQVPLNTWMGDCLRTGM